MKHGRKIDPDQLFVNLLTAPQYRLLRHLILIVTIVMLSACNVYVEFSSNTIFWQLLICVLVFSPILLNVYIFVPRILFRNKPYLFLTAVITTVLFVLGINVIIQILNADMIFETYKQYGNLPLYIAINNFSTLVSFSLILSGTTAIMIMQAWLRDRIKISELEAASAKTELEMLKNQINPHFLFNMLNNSIVLTRENPQQAREIILKLRRMLDYQLEKSLVEKISLEEDINFLNNLLMLEKVRRDDFDYHIAINGDIKGTEVPPLLFIPLVENAIKHGNDASGKSYILLVFRQNEHRLTFFCTNSVPRKPALGTGSGGLGLANVKRRLELLYGSDYSLCIDKTEKTFNVNLSIGI